MLFVLLAGQKTALILFAWLINRAFLSSNSALLSLSLTAACSHTIFVNLRPFAHMFKVQSSKFKVHFTIDPEGIGILDYNNYTLITMGTEFSGVLADGYGSRHCTVGNTD